MRGLKRTIGVSLVTGEEVEFFEPIEIVALVPGHALAPSAGEILEARKTHQATLARMLGGYHGR